MCACVHARAFFPYQQVPDQQISDKSVTEPERGYIFKEETKVLDRYFIVSIYLLGNFKLHGKRSTTVAVRTGKTAPLLLFELKGYCGGLPKCSLFSLFKPTLPPNWEHSLRYNTNFVNISVYKMSADRKCYYSVLWLQIQITVSKIFL